MALKVDVLGKKDLDKLARRMHVTASKTLPREMDKGLRDAGDAIGHAIRAASDIYMPKGYERVFARSLVIKTEVKGGATRKVVLTVRAFGRKGNPRQVDELEKGRIKHPFWGRWVHRPSAWQRIRPHFATEPAKRATPAAVRKLDQAAGRVARSV